MTFKIEHSHGVTEGPFDTYELAQAAVRSVYGDDVEIGHDGDISDGHGQRRTLCWPDAATATNDDGSRACCTIIALETAGSW